MVHNAISLFRQNQAKLFRQTKTDETVITLRQKELGSDFLAGFSDARRGWWAQNWASADRSTFGSHSREKISKGLSKQPANYSWDSGSYFQLASNRAAGAITSNVFPFPFRTAPAAYTSAPFLLS